MTLLWLDLETTETDPQKDHILDACPRVPLGAPKVIANSALAQADGLIHADVNTLPTQFENVHAIGVNTHIVLGNGKPLTAPVTSTPNRHRQSS